MFIFYILLLLAFFAIAEGFVLGVMVQRKHKNTTDSYRLRQGAEFLLRKPGTTWLFNGCALNAKTDIIFSASKVAIISTSVTEMSANIDDVTKRAADGSSASQLALIKTGETKGILNSSHQDTISLNEQKTGAIADVMSSIEAAARTSAEGFYCLLISSSMSNMVLWIHIVSASLFAFATVH